MAESAELAAPVVGRAAGLHQDDRRPALGEETEEGGTGQAVALSDAAGLLGHSDLEDGLGQIDRDRRMLHLGLLLPSGVL